MQGDGVDTEHIVVDGGSADETNAVLAGYPHVKVMHDPGIGQSHAVNMGLKASRGEVIGWLNADDRYAPDAFAGAKQALADHPDVSIVYGNARVIDRSGAAIGDLRPGPFDLSGMLNGINPIPQPAVFIRASLLSRIGLLDERLDYVMDYELWLRAAQVSRLLWVDSLWAEFRRHPSSKTESESHRFWPEKRSVARRYGGPFFSQEWRWRTLNRTYPSRLVEDLRYRILSRRARST
jgi:glycosyltransferase involved in cell wall biosynthesis